MIEAGGGNNADIAISNDDALHSRRNHEMANADCILGTADLRSHRLFDQVPSSRSIFWREWREGGKALRHTMFWSPLALSPDPVCLNMP